MHFWKGVHLSVIEGINPGVYEGGGRCIFSGGSTCECEQRPLKEGTIIISKVCYIDFLDI